MNFRRNENAAAARAASVAPMRMGAFEWGLLILLAAIWGGSFFFAQVALDELRPFTIVLARVGIAAIALWAVVLGTGLGFPRDPRLWAAFAVMGFLNNFLPFSLIFWGQTEIGSALASILNATTPVFTVIFAHFLTRDERMTAGKVAGVLLGLGGVAVMIGPKALEGLSGGVWGQVAVVGAGVSYALAGIFGRRFAGQPPMLTAAGQVTMSSLMIAPVALLYDRPWDLAPPTMTTWGSLLGLSLVCTAFAYIIYFRILKTAGATNLLLVTLLVPATAILLGTLVLGEVLAVRELAGMAFIAVAILAIDGRVWEGLRGLFTR